MSFTKVAPAGIGTSPGNSILIGDSLLHSTGIDIGSNTGAGVTIRQHGDATFTGIITASAFFGDGSGLEGVSSSGIGTALNDDDTNVLNKIYYVNQELSIGSTVTVNHPDTGTASYTHYQDLVVKNDADFIVSDGDTFIPDILGINTSGLPSPRTGATGGRIRAGTITNAGANGAVNFPNGLTGTAGTFTGNLNVGGVLTYEDVTNIDSVGVITGRSNINCTGGRFQRGTATVQDGDAIAGGININGTDMDASVIMSVFGNDNDFTRISGSKSRNASVGSHTIVQNNDVLLSLKGFGSDGTNFEEAAQIEMQVDGTPNNNVMPGRIVFKTTTTDGVAERLRVTNTGEVGIGTVTPDSTGGNGGGGLHIHGPQSDNCRLTFTTPTKHHPKPAIGFFGLSRFGMDTWDGLEIRDVTASYATRFKIDENGYRTIPNQPNFLTHTHGAALSANNYNYIVIANSYFNVGSCYNGSNGRFTAPIDGYYFFYGVYTPQNSVSAPVLGFHKNGGSHQGEALNYSATYDGTSMQQVKQLSAGDYVNWSCRDWNNQTPDPWHTWWGGYLLY